MSEVYLRRGRFRIRFGYDPRIIQAVKNISGRRFDPEEKEWNAPTSAIEEVIEFAMQFDFTVSDEAKELFERFNNMNVKLDPKPVDLDSVTVSGFPLKDHQRSGINFMTERRRVILADDMGLGKTVQALVAASAWGLTTYVVCPSSLIEMWRRESRSMNVPVEIISWAQKKFPVPDRPFVLIADEAHYAQSGTKSIRGENFLELAAHPLNQATFCLTGTPMKNGRPSNIFPLLQAVRHKLSKNAGYFYLHFCDAHKTQWSSFDISGAINLVELHDLTKDCILRRTKDECLDLPGKVRIIKPLVLEGTAMKEYESAVREVCADYEAGLFGSPSKPEDANAIAVMKIRMASSMAKATYAIEMAQDLIEAGEPVVIFTEFLNTASAVASALGVTPYTGETSLEERTAIVDRFQRGDDMAFVATSRAGGVGLTLTKACNCIMIDRPYTPGDTLQAEDRIYRIGQTKKAMIFWLSLGEIDEMIDSNLVGKSSNAYVVLKGEDGDSECEMESVRDVNAKIMRRFTRRRS